ncbi:glutamyl-tRNA amidotransferase [Helicobacter enhydrae]|uniref:Glutamyl-tRNA amidotransferase n=1 Tax=Helicobacter enhydrae TaxID=222136 RepID=A0A1B1U4Y9_9HELI|nr:GatB/YqeY domain-containing protein [Helicobacter enhydrae]ANV97819.1 glutamyl-tRNA amidotransferase [Helicobacter enhydrae]
MSAIKEKMALDLKEAMKNGEHFKRDVLRLLNASLKQVEVDERIVLDDDRVIGILKSALKQREDSLEAYISAGREDLADHERGEIDVILSYLPRQLEDHELKQEVVSIIQEVGASGIKDLGKVMAAAKRLAQVADGKRISAFAKELLS